MMMLALFMDSIYVIDNYQCTVYHVTLNGHGQAIAAAKLIKPCVRVN
jgi:hypothetical protein